MDLYRIITFIHISLGFLLVFFAARAYKRSNYIPMIYLAFGFILITLGDTIIGDSLVFLEQGTRDIVEEIVEISGFVLVILAVIKS
jgi:dipeptide/tripeptide permease